MLRTLMSIVKCYHPLEFSVLCTSCAVVQVTYSLLMPANNPGGEEAYVFQTNCMKSGIVAVALKMLTRNNFMPSADLPTKR